MNEILMRTVIDALAFLALSNEDVVDPDASIAQVEILASRLRELPEAEKAQLLRYMGELLKESTEKAMDERWLNFLRNAPEDLGLL
jgi:hypothetical protein